MKPPFRAALSDVEDRDAGSSPGLQRGDELQGGVQARDVEACVDQGTGDGGAGETVRMNDQNGEAITALRRLGRRNRCADSRGCGSNEIRY